MEIVVTEIKFLLSVLQAVLQNPKLEDNCFVELMQMKHIKIIVEIFKEEKDKIKRFDALVNYEPRNDYFYPYKNEGDDPDYEFGYPAYNQLLTFLEPFERFEKNKLEELKKQLEGFIKYLELIINITNITNSNFVDI